MFSFAFIVYICAVLRLALSLLPSCGEQTGGHRHPGMVHRPHVRHRSAHLDPANYLLHPAE